MAINKVELCGVNTSRLPVLNAEEKETLLKKAREGDAAARERYIQGNLRLVLSVIKRFSNSSENADDLFQIGCIGLIKAIDNFDTTLNVRFSTYAVPVILGEIKKLFRDGICVTTMRSASAVPSGILPTAPSAPANFISSRTRKSLRSRKSPLKSALEKRISSMPSMQSKAQ